MRLLRTALFLLWLYIEPHTHRFYHRLRLASEMVEDYYQKKAHPYHVDVEDDQLNKAWPAFHGIFVYNQVEDARDLLELAGFTDFWISIHSYRSNRASRFVICFKEQHMATAFRIVL